MSDRFDESNRNYEFFRNGWHCKNCFHSMCWVLLCFILVHCILEAIWIISLMLELLYFRWWAVLVEPRVVSKQVVVVHRHRYLRHPALQRSLLHRPSCFAKLSKGSSSSEADAMTTNLSQQRTRISLGHTLLCSTGRRNPLMLTLGLIQSSPSLTCW